LRAGFFGGGVGGGSFSTGSGGGGCEKDHKIISFKHDFRSCAVCMLQVELCYVISRGKELPDGAFNVFAVVTKGT
jgi:hypothetical protein